MIRPSLSIVFTILLAPLGALANTAANLTWDAKEVRLKGTAADKELVAKYQFKNTGTEVVNFKNFNAACSCVSIEVSTMRVAPGDSGVVTVKFTPEYRMGKQTRPIAITFDDGAESRMALYLHVEIPEVVKPQPIFLKWAEAEEIRPKSVDIVPEEGYAIESMTVKSVNRQWQAKVSPIANSKNYSLEVLPIRRAQPYGEYVVVEAKLANGLVKRTNLYVVVR